MQPDFWNDKRPTGVTPGIDLHAYKSVVEVFERSCRKFADRPAIGHPLYTPENVPWQGVPLQLKESS